MADGGEVASVAVHFRINTFKMAGQRRLSQPQLYIARSLRFRFRL